MAARDLIISRFSKPRLTAFGFQAKELLNRERETHLIRRFLLPSSLFATDESSDLISFTDSAKLDVIDDRKRNWG